MPEQKTLDVVGIGNAIVDVLVQADDAVIEGFGLTKGTMALIDQDQAETLYAELGPGLETSGGSAANTLAGIAQLGGRAGFIGRVRDDQLGTIFAHDICAVGTRYETPAATAGASTARCLILVSPDAQRTMCTYLGASVGLDLRRALETRCSSKATHRCHPRLRPPAPPPALLRQLVPASCFHLGHSTNTPKG